MTELIFVIGLPGSGKSYYISSHKKESDLVFDDIRKEELQKLKSAIGVVSRIFVADPNFCDSNLLKNAIEMFSECKIKLVYFENNPEKCYQNVEYRNDDRNVSGTIERFRKIYFPPKNARKIWSKK